MKEVIYSLKENLNVLFKNAKKELPEILKFMKEHKLISVAFILITIIVIILMVNLTAISKNVNATIVSKYSSEYVEGDTSKFTYHIIVNQKTLFGTKEKEYLVSNKDLYNYIKPEVSYKLKILNNSYISKVTELNINNTVNTNTDTK